MRGSNLSRLRKKAGYSNARAFAEAATTISGTSYGRFEADPTRIPMLKAWEIADALGCTIDDVVGRTTTEEARTGAIQMRYDALDAEQRQYIEECLAYAEYRMAERQRAKASQAKAEYLASAYSFAHILMGSTTSSELYSTFTVEDLKEEYERYLEKLNDQAVSADVESFSIELRESLCRAREIGFEYVSSPITTESAPQRVSCEEDVLLVVKEYEARRREFFEKRRPNYLQAFDEVFGTSEKSKMDAFKALSPAVPEGYRPSWQKAEDQQ